MKERHKSIRIFENPYLEKLTHVHPIIPLVIWGPFTFYLFGRAYFTLGMSFSKIASFSFFGLMLWTLAEYLLHRFIFHIPPHNAFLKRVQFIIHGLHHDDPVDPTRLVMPPAAAVILAFLLFNFFRLFFGPIYVVPFFAGFIIGYLCYDYTHFLIHHRVPKTVMGKRIRAYHLKHHYATPDARWGVSSPLWDYVFGTLGSRANPKKVSVPPLELESEN